MSNPNTSLTRSLSIAASTEQAYSAMSLPAEIVKWWGEHADVELVPGGPYKLWGPAMFANPSEDTADQTLLEFTPNARLLIRWPWRTHFVSDGSVPRVVVWEVLFTSEGEGCRVTVNLSWEGGGTMSGYSLDDTVQVTLYCLRSYLESGTVEGRLAYSGGAPVIQVGIQIHASADDVWHALTDPTTMDRWVSSGASVDLSEGGRYSYGWTEEVNGERVTAGPTIITELKEKQRLSHGWTYGDEPPTQVTWELKTDRGSTELTLTHSGFGVALISEDYRQGWIAFLFRAQSLLEGRGMVE